MSRSPFRASRQTTIAPPRLSQSASGAVCAAGAERRVQLVAARENLLLREVLVAAVVDLDERFKLGAGGERVARAAVLVAGFALVRPELVLYRRDAVHLPPVPGKGKRFGSGGPDHGNARPDIVGERPDRREEPFRFLGGRIESRRLPRAPLRAFALQPLVDIAGLRVHALPWDALPVKRRAREHEGGERERRKPRAAPDSGASEDTHGLPPMHGRISERSALPRSQDNALSGDCHRLSPAHTPR
jgi:hypothetical protein